MPADVYVSFGEDSDPDNPYPLIEGDSTDEDHLWWCELRGSSFTVKPDPAKAPPEKGQAKDTAPFEHVQLTKRVDWASTDLFQKCCEGAEAKIAKSKAKSEDAEAPGAINKVRIEVCKAAGQKKFPYSIIEYYGVRIVDFAISMNDPEPSETITIAYDGFAFGYQKTDPYTGLPVGEMRMTERITARKKSSSADDAPTTSGATPAAAAAAAGGGGAAGGAGAAGAASLAAAATGNSGSAVG